MNIYNYHIVKLFVDYQKKDTSAFLSDLDTLSDALADLTTTLFDSKIKDTGDLEAILAKLVLHVKSIVALVKYTELRGKKIFDPGSVFILARALLENYLMVDYLFSPRISSELVTFRFDLYKYAGLKNRQSYYSISDYSKAKKAKEKKEMDELYKKIKDSNIYQAFTKREKDNLKLDTDNPSSKTHNWYQLISGSDLDTEKFTSVWKWFSNYSHSEYIGLIQIKEIFTKQVQVENVNLVIHLCLMIVASMIKDLIEYYPSIKIKYNILPSKVHAIVNVQSGVAQGSSKTP